ncbi:DNA polymerase III subunit alpha [Draconibacterium halophilum]|uniref:DNA polymerase III subunit alpha n=1 Tax=Draconibacterium halophilum TaxID=2706887 RepID=A0A6C0R8Y6_9BACT|nr:DNA polymerase III subunit alpha [Draconibacterium halophilum]QIA06914.1 DNA polymerase III subunit alpha [Draconibacterium halophilum]
MVPFTHLHVHSQYSILDGAASISDLVNKAKGDNMPALAITDHGTMFGIKEFHAACSKAEIKPILGCETYVASRSISNKSDKVDRSGHHLILLAKNKVGYRNLIKLISIASTSGFYYKPRIDKELLEKYHEGLVASSACLGGEIPQLLMANNMKDAEKSVLWYKKLFGEDYYLELMRHPAQSQRERESVYDWQVKVNKQLIPLAKKLGVKLIATNDIHFTNESDAEAHDLLICLNTGKDFDDPNRMRYTKQEWFKTQAEMNELFKDVPEALANTKEIAEKVEAFELDTAPIMPVFPIPEKIGTEEGFKEKYSEADLRKEFSDAAFERLGGYEKVIRVKLESAFLEHLTFEGAKERYGDPLEKSVEDRLIFELNTIKTMGYPGYFLITQDFINWAKDNGVIVGPGRGSAAGAAVSYCAGITNIDPIKYDLLFERFLNPDRISLPDVDIDFDDDGRQQVLNYVTDKYGEDKVAHICTFGTMATKSSIRDVARVLKLPLPEADRLAKLVPEAPKMSFKKAFKESPDLAREKNSTIPLVVDTLTYAEKLEGSVRNTGVHACGILISRDTLTDHIPLMPTKDEEHLLTTQYDGRFVEDIGLLKMDFLGLKTLSIIKECLENIKLSKGIDVSINEIPLDDEKTFQLFSYGETTAIFQFESDGMKKHLRDLKPNRFEDLVAMNALYRPGPMEYIPDYIARKHGKQKVDYDVPMMEEYLSDTYGITVFQEQVMLLSRLLAGFTRGDSDTLRKAMGKKIMSVMEKLKVKFVDGCKANRQFVDECKNKGKTTDEVIHKIWKDWEAFASYAFNKSHSVCYAYIAYQTGFLKAHYPAEFMAANLSRNLNNITDITKLMTECKRMKLNVLGPDVNESFIKFTANKEGDIRFGMGAIKGVGSGAVQHIINVRNEKGHFKTIYDLVEHVNLQSVNKKNLEALAMAGAFENLEGVNRSCFFAGEHENDDTNFIEKLIRYGNRLQLEANSAQQSLFGGAGMAQDIQKPAIPKVDEWAKLIMLEKEKNLIGIYLTAHPLDDFRLEITNFCSRDVALKDLNNDISKYKDKDFTFGGMVTAAREGQSKNGNMYAVMTLSDYTDSKELFFFGNDYVNFSKFCKVGIFIMVKGSVRTRFKSDFYEFKVNSIELLDNVRENYIKSLTINIPLKALTEDVVKRIDHIANEYKGKTLLKFNVFDTENNMYIEMFSRTTRVNPLNSFLKFFDEQPEMTYRIN